MYKVEGDMDSVAMVGTCADSFQFSFKYLMTDPVCFKRLVLAVFVRVLDKSADNGSS